MAAAEDQGSGHNRRLGLEPTHVADLPHARVVKISDQVLAGDVEPAADVGCSSSRQCRQIQ
jgi:hypothetical protein